MSKKPKARYTDSAQAGFLRDVASFLDRGGNLAAFPDGVRRLHQLAYRIERAVKDKRKTNK